MGRLTIEAAGGRTGSAAAARPFSRMRERKIDWPDVVATIPRGRRRIPLADSPDPARAAWIERVLADPSGARRDLEAARADYWRRRVARLEAEAADACRQIELAAARDEETGLPAAGPETLAALEHERAEALAALNAARRRLRDCEQAAASPHRMAAGGAESAAVASPRRPRF